MEVALAAVAAVVVTVVVVVVVVAVVVVAVALLGRASQVAPLQSLVPPIRSIQLVLVLGALVLAERGGPNQAAPTRSMSALGAAAQANRRRDRRQGRRRGALIRHASRQCRCKPCTHRELCK
jgi:hypothetical protein